MARQKFEDWKPSPESRRMVQKASNVIDEYRAEGFTLTIRQLYYQLVAHDLFPADRRFVLVKNKWVRSTKADATPNATPNYKWIITLMSRARLAGMIDWEAIEDRERELVTINTWRSPAEVIEACEEQYREDLWRHQHIRIEVWIEKRALTGVIDPVCQKWRLPYFACRGNVSQSAQHEASERFIENAGKSGKPTLVLHLGDHDPNGIDMTRDNVDRLKMFTRQVPGCVTVKRIALNYDQVERYNPPPNPVKDGDTRSGGYRDRFGDECWELDALDPKVIHKLIEDEVKKVVNMKKWDDAKVHEKSMKDVLGDARAWVEDRWS